ncbi:MAG: hypothetical protein DRP47_06615 [Candidatus Zixiibacteriota bacterium]|nr:MAG: hypothetical protein DRP47_06615 [candidate division Zixibacteria bacterium]
MNGLFSECKVLYVDHLAVTTSDFETTLQDYLSLDGSRLLKGPGVNIGQRVRYAFVQLQNGCTVEVLAPEEKSPIAKHVLQGGGPYHFCYAVRDIEQSIAVAENRGAKLVSQPIADVAFDGRRVAFLCHEAHGVFEFVEAYPQSKMVNNALKPSDPPFQPVEIITDTLSEDTDIEGALQRVFSKVFPRIEISTLFDAAMDKSEEWDSLAQIQLVMELESEFSINVQSDQIENLTTYLAILHHLREEL